MRRWAMAGLAALHLMAPTMVAADGLAANVAELRAFADRFDQAQIAGDGAALDRMVSDDLVFIAGSGQRLGKTDFIAGWTEPGTRYEPVTLEDRVIMPLGSDAGIASAAVTIRGVSDGKAFASRIRFADTFHRINGEWRAVHIQVTKLP
ncbi:nuclear transport factor 2 family protein [Sphingomonas cavernae]|uniref:Nuclear transport factor 2 family protein n=1 Tax=Sphingomonas cavernae TaxID=2320861 RepID=A0A418WQK8_9SPHN|nr:nuclear transport factor 2 family protein [Sphingomonas cavernae]RJF93534.1 nuclear transport factor 2 family protein [Sphingomonas cavernae]